MEQEIIKPVEKELIKSELTPERQLRMTNRSHNEIYVIDEIGRASCRERVSEAV